MLHVLIKRQMLVRLELLSQPKQIKRALNQEQKKKCFLNRLKELKIHLVIMVEVVGKDLVQVEVVDKEKTKDLVSAVVEDGEEIKVWVGDKVVIVFAQVADIKNRTKEVFRAIKLTVRNVIRL